jgi:hypothetical protein
VRQTKTLVLMNVHFKKMVIPFNPNARVEVMSSFKKVQKKYAGSSEVEAIISSWQLQKFSGCYSLDPYLKYWVFNSGPCIC